MTPTAGLWHRYSSGLLSEHSARRRVCLRRSGVTQHALPRTISLSETANEFQDMPTLTFGRSLGEAQPWSASSALNGDPTFVYVSQPKHPNRISCSLELTADFRALKDVTVPPGSAWTLTSMKHSSGWNVSQKGQPSHDERMGSEPSFARLQEEDLRFRLIIDSIQDYAVYMLDRQGRITTWDSGAEQGVHEF